MLRDFYSNDSDDETDRNRSQVSVGTNLNERDRNKIIDIYGKAQQGFADIAEGF